MPARNRAWVIKVLEAARWEFKRPGAKHDIYDREGAERPISVPRHRKDFGPDLLSSILRQAGLSIEDAEKLVK
jgi:predicted RNA binding protein YcfA (HicA-like mRNA interferase family)